MICVPLLGQEGRPLGVIQLDTKSLRHQFTQTDLDVLVSVGAGYFVSGYEASRLGERLLSKRVQSQLSASPVIFPILYPPIHWKKLCVIGRDWSHTHRRV